MIMNTDKKNKKCKIDRNELSSLVKGVAIASRRLPKKDVEPAIDFVQSCGQGILNPDELKFLTHQKKSYNKETPDKLFMLTIDGCRWCKLAKKAIKDSGLEDSFEILQYNKKIPRPTDKKFIQLGREFKVEGFPTILNNKCMKDPLAGRDPACSITGAHGPQALRRIICTFSNNPPGDGFCDPQNKKWKDIFEQYEENFENDQE